MFQIQTEKIEEEIIKQGGAGLLKMYGITGGTLYLTPKRLILKPDERSVPISAIMLEEVTKARVFSMLGLIKNGMRIDSKKGSIVFFLEEKHDWIQKINEQVAKMKSG